MRAYHCGSQGLIETGRCLWMWSYTLIRWTFLGRLRRIPVCGGDIPCRRAFRNADSRACSCVCTWGNSLVGRAGLEPATPWLKVRLTFSQILTCFQSWNRPEKYSVFNQSGWQPFLKYQWLWISRAINKLPLVTSFVKSIAKSKLVPHNNLL